MNENFVMYGRPDCLYCNKAKDSFNLMGLSFTYLDINETENREALKLLLPNANQIPQIFSGRKHIGGYDDLRVYLTKMVENDIW